MLPTIEDEEKAKLASQEPEEDDELADNEPDDQPVDFGENIFSRFRKRFDKNQEQKAGAREMASKFKTAEKAVEVGKKGKMLAILLSSEIWIPILIGAVIIIVILAIVIVFANLARDPADGGKSPAQTINTDNSLDQEELKILKALNSASTSEEMVKVVGENKDALKHIVAILAEERIDIEKIPQTEPPKATKKEILDEITTRINDNLDAVSADLKKDKRDKIFTEIRNDLKTLVDYADQYPKTS